MPTRSLIFGDAVIEHHSNAESDPGQETSASRLACENWDAPIVVTTNVQFFESLFAARTSRCRKLHNLVDSVVILDEAQLLPPEFLQPMLDVLNLLTQHYGVSVVLCGAHRSQVIGDIKARLKAGVPTRVVSTQLVEAGVDVDFPVVFRALAGLDSIAQAAGRCNREGHLAAKGEVVVFVPPTPAPPGLLRRGEDVCRDVLYGATEQPLARERFASYFERLYHACELDKKGICDDLCMAGNILDGFELAVNFRTAAENFKLIEDEDSAPIIVRYLGKDGLDDSIGKWLNTLRKDGPNRWLMRKLQRYTVNLHRTQAMQLLRQGDIEEIMPGLFVQVSDWLYDPTLGLNPEGTPVKPGCIA